ncbi:hypothetical protein [Streptomyces sp. NPDC096152]|uniref:hypothetical protein n=1 Tax=Streptomyces sp. NPDC096152 TaxID=3366078 RepID=UPI003825D77F
MADERNTESSLVPRRPRDLVVTTIVWELAGLAACGAIALALRPFGWLPDPPLSSPSPPCSRPGP